MALVDIRGHLHGSLDLYLASPIGFILQMHLHLLCGFPLWCCVSLGFDVQGASPIHPFSLPLGMLGSLRSLRYKHIIDNKDAPRLPLITPVLITHDHTSQLICITILVTSASRFVSTQLIFFSSLRKPRGNKPRSIS